MDTGTLLSRFDGRSRLLVRSLLCGASGARGALEVLRRQQRAGAGTGPGPGTGPGTGPGPGPGPGLQDLVESLCRDQVCCPGCEAPLTATPLLLLLPAVFQVNLLSFISQVRPPPPRPALLLLLRCLSRAPGPGPWVSALLRQLERSLGVRSGEPLSTEACSRRLSQLSQRSAAGAAGWAACFGGAAAAAADSELQRASGSQRKRKSSLVSPDSDGEQTEQQSKRVKLDGGEEEEQTAGGGGAGAPAEELQPPESAPQREELPQHLKASVLQIKEFLDSETEWDQSSMEAFKVLNDCDPGQVEVLCSVLGFPDLPEQTLPKLCSSILAPSSDLGFGTAAALIRSLLLQKVRSLSEPASRCLVSAATSLCSRYPRPTCHALIAPVLEDRSIGNLQAELLVRLTGSCLEAHHRLLLLQMTLNVTWSEAVLSIIHSLLESKPDVSEELFSGFAEQLVLQTPSFTKSVKFAKMLLTLLTKFSGHVTPAHRRSLHGCILLNETFLKKSLQAALRRIADV